MLDPDHQSYFEKDPDAKLDFAVDWTAWLPAGDTITTATWNVPSGITQPSSPAASVSGGKAIVWLEGGTAGETYAVTCHIVTSQGRADDRVIRIVVRNR